LINNLLFFSTNLGLPNTERVVLPSVDGWWDDWWSCLSIHVRVQRSSRRICKEREREREREDRKRTSWSTVDCDKTLTAQPQISIISAWLYKKINEAISNDQSLVTVDIHPCSSTKKKPAYMCRWCHVRQVDFGQTVYSRRPAV